MVFLQKGAPGIVQQSGVGLQSVLHLNAFPLLHLGGEVLEVGKPSQCGLASLEGKGNPVSRRQITADMLEDLPGSLRGHNAEGAHLAQIGHLRIEAVSAPQIAQAGCRFEHDTQLFHIVLPNAV